MLDCMRTVLAGILIVVALVALVSQLALPAFIEGRVEDRLEEGGGEAQVAIQAVPALTLLAGRGRSFHATGTGLHFDLADQGQDPFKRLDGFKRVDMQLRDLDTGPLKVGRFVLTRAGRHEPYKLHITAATTPRELSALLGGAAGAVGGLIGSLAGEVLPGAADLAIPVRLGALVDSRSGKPNVRSARATVAGFPAGPLAEIVLGTVLDRL